MNNLSRNNPIALVVGCTGFIGSHVVEKLLDKNIQVIGVDDFSSGDINNLENAQKNRHFYFIRSSIAEVSPLELPRLDYAFFCIGESASSPDSLIGRFFEVTHKFGPKLELLSSINLYDKDVKGESFLIQSEKVFAQYAAKFNLNARVVRLSTIFGPRMIFNEKDQLHRLLFNFLNDKKDQNPLDFNTRAIFIDDAVELLIKAVMHGGSSQKIFDGSSSSPISLTEVDQILEDPLWYENIEFTPTKLPGIASPNLLKTQKQLLWKSKTPLVKALKETVAFFKTHPDRIPTFSERREENKTEHVSGRPIFGPPQKSSLSNFKQEEGQKENILIEKKNNFQSILNIGFALIAFGCIFYFLIYPFFNLVKNVWVIRNDLILAQNLSEKGEYDQASTQIGDAKEKIKRVGEFDNFLTVISKVVPFAGFYKLQQSGDLLVEIVDGANQALDGAKGVGSLLSEISGENKQQDSSLYDQTYMHLSTADDKFSLASAILDSFKESSYLPGFFKNNLVSWKSTVDDTRNLLSSALGLTEILRSMANHSNREDFLFVVFDENNARDGGGKVLAIADLTFSKGIVSSIDSQSALDFDNTLTGLSISAPTELQNDLGLANLTLENSFYSPDFPTTAKNLIAFYKLKTGISASGVVAIDIRALSNLLQPLGPVDLKNNETIDNTNLVQQVIMSKDAQLSSSILKTVLQRLFLVPNEPWNKVVSVLGSSLKSKDALIYLSDGESFSYLTSANWDGILPRQTLNSSGKHAEFLGYFETNLNQNESEYFVTRKFNLKTNIANDWSVTHKLSIDYANQSQDTSFPGGVFNGKIRIYLPSGSSLQKVLWKGQEVTSDVGSFSDFGRSGYDYKLTLSPKEEGVLEFDYQDAKPLIFNNGKVNLSLQIVKQPGLSPDPFDIVIDYPQGLVEDLHPKDKAIYQDIHLDSDHSLNFEFSNQ